MIKNLPLGFNIPALAHVSSLGKQCLQGMLERDITKRLTADQVLEHDWYSCRSKALLHAVLLLSAFIVLQSVSCGAILCSLCMPLNASA